MGLARLSKPLVIHTRGQAIGGVTCNAAGELAAVHGFLRLEGGPGTKTLSAAGGGAILTAYFGVTFSNAGTNLRIGLQDVDLSTGFQDGTFDVYADLVGGTDTITAQVWRRTPMEVGSKTLSHGDRVSIVSTMTARGGADSVVVARLTAITTEAPGLPYGTNNTGSDAKSQDLLMAMIEFDDGTYGWVDLAVPLCATALSAQAVDSDDSPDEYAAIFKLVYRAGVSTIGLYLTNIAAGDDFELVLYSDPLGTPAVIEAVSVDPDYLITTAPVVSVQLASVAVLEPNTYYAIALRPTTTNAISLGYHDLGSGFDVLKRTHRFSEIIMGGRTGQTGAFVETQAYHLPVVFVGITRLDDGLGVAEAACQIGVI